MEAFAEAAGDAIVAADAQGAIIAAIMRDETARWEEERALRKRLAELEGKAG